MQNSMAQYAQKWRDTYAITPRRGFIQREFGLGFCLETWYVDGLPRDVDLDAFFHYEPSGVHGIAGLGWCEAAFCPEFEERVLEDRGETEVVQDNAGRSVLYFKGRRQGFMPEYIFHPVTDRKSWHVKVRPRLEFDHPLRRELLQKERDRAVAAMGQGLAQSQHIIGGYMYLRSLIGPEELLYMFYDDPGLIHECMAAWLELAERTTAYMQQTVTYDEVFFGEDICYNHGPLIAPEMIREFLFPYYRQLLDGIRSRQRDGRRLHVQLDTDGYCDPVIELYRDEVGVDVFSPFEAASGCDVVAVGRKYPELVLSGGFDKRILAAGKDAIDREVDRIFPVMYERGGYIPTCDHGVPAEVNWRDYWHYRQRCYEFA